MAEEDNFYERADAVIHLANQQREQIAQTKVSASLLYGAARFNAHVAASSYDNASEFSAAKAEIIERLSTSYRAMLEEHLDDYIENFQSYMKHAIQ